MKIILITLLCLLSTSCQSSQTHFDEHVKRTFHIEILEGWQLYINAEVLKNPAWPEAKRIMAFQLYNIKKVLNEQVIKDMQKVRIYIDIPQKGKSGAEYHPSKKWLVDNNFSPEKAKCVEVSNVDNFIKYTMRQPWVMLHELMHSYHDQVLSFDNPEVLACYQKAMADKKYRKVKMVDGRVRLHYSRTNHKEYLAEAAEAYFGVNDYFPFVRAELLEYDPEVCEILKKMSK